MSVLREQRSRVGTFLVPTLLRRVFPRGHTKRAHPTMLMPLSQGAVFVAEVGWARFCAHAVAESISAWAQKTCPPYHAEVFVGWVEAIADTHAVRLMGIAEPVLSLIEGLNPSYGKAAVFARAALRLAFSPEPVEGSGQAFAARRIEQ